MSGDTDPLLLTKANWPEADRVAWHGLFADGDILDGRGPCFHWSEGSRWKREQSYSRWLAFLTGAGALTALERVSDRATMDNVSAFIACERERCKAIAVHMRLEDLWLMFQALDPKRNWEWLRHVLLRLRAVSDIGYLKPCPGVDAVQIFDWALSRLKALENEAGPFDLDRAVRYRDGLQVGTLISTPLRSRTFVGIEIGRHLRRLGDGYMLSFQPADVKDKKRHDYPLHSRLVAPMDRYLEVYRPILLQGTVTDGLWVSRRGAPLCADSFAGHLGDLTRREFGEKLGPHAFRHVAATTIALHDPEHVGIIADVLGHSSLDMVYKHYNHAGTIRAVTRHQDLLRQLKLEARRRERAARRWA